MPKIDAIDLKFMIQPSKVTKHFEFLDNFASRIKNRDSQLRRLLSCTYMKAKSIIKYVVSLALAALLLWASFREVEWQNFIQGVKGCRWEFVLLSMALGSFAFLLRGLRWRRLLLPIDDSISRMTAFNGVNIGNISNFVFPRIGEFVRCGVITRRSAPVDDASLNDAQQFASETLPIQKKATYDKVLGTVVLERGWELLVMLLMLAIVVVGGFDRFGSFFIEQIWEPLSSKFDFSIWWLVAAFVGTGGLVTYAIWRFRESNAFCARIWRIFSGIVQGFSSCLNMEKKWLFFAYTALIWMTYWLMAASIMWAAPFLEGLDMIDALFLSLVGGLGFAVPVPGGIGAFHFVIGLALSMVYGLPMEVGIIYATLSHTCQAITQILFGLFSYVYEAVKQ